MRTIGGSERPGGIAITALDARERFERFHSALAFRADLGTSPPGIELAALDGEPIVPPVRLHVDAESLAEHAGAPVGPADVDPEAREDLEAARLQSLLALVEEAILGRAPGHDHLVLVDGGVRAVREEDLAA